MKIVPLIGAVLLLLGILSFVVPIPHKETHSVKFGDTKFGVQTEENERLPIAASITLVGAGALLLVVGLQKK
jgi:hypothetical protein